MSRWKVNKERINNDIPSANGNIPDGGFVTYPTKRLIVDAMKMVGNKKIESYNYIKENVTPNQKEERDGVNIDNPKSEIITGLPIANYRGIDMRHALSSKTNGKFNQYFVPVDDEFNVGLPIKGYNDPSGNYEVPHINFGINDFWIRKSNRAYSKDNISKEDEDYYISYNENKDNVKNKHISYGCYPLMDRYEKYTIKGTKESDPVGHAPDFVDLDLRGNYTVMSFIIEESANYKLASWHFHTTSSVYLSNDSLSPTVYNYKLERSEDSLPYTLINRNNSAGLAVHTLFFEYENEITYNDTNKTKSKTQLNWGLEQSNNPIILVRRLMRDKNGNILRGDNDEPQWKLCIHAKTNTKYTLKTWNIMKNEFDSINSFYKDTILKGVVSYDETEFTNFLEAGGDVGDEFVKAGLYVDIRLYAEECIEGGTGGGTDNKSFDVPEHILHTKDVRKTKEYRYYDILNREEWKKTKSEDKSCVDDTTCKLFREYTQQILPSTAIVKAPRCQINEENTYVKDEKISDLAPENINYTEWEEEVLENSSDEFVKAVFDVYFDSLEGTNIEKKTYTITSKDDYDKYINGTLGANLITSYPKVDGTDAEYWYMSANKSIVEDGVELPDLYKFGGSAYQKVDFYKHSGIHFYPNLYQKVTYALYFYAADYTTVLAERKEEIQTKSEYDQIVAGTKTNYQTPPAVDNLAYWVKGDDRNLTTHTDKQKYGTTNTQKIDLYTNNGVKFYPIVYKPVTYKVVLYSPKGNIMKEQEKTIQTYDEYNQFIKGDLAPDYVEAPTKISIDGYNNNPIGFWVTEDKWDKTKLSIKNDEVMSDDKYGDDENVNKIDMSNHSMFGDKTELHFYPFVGVNDINHIVVSFNMKGGKDLDNITEIYNGETGEILTYKYNNETKTLGPIGWASFYLNKVGGNKVYQYGYDAINDVIIPMKTDDTDPAMFGHSGDNQKTGYEGSYIYVNPLKTPDKEEYIDNNTLCSKSLSELYPDVELFKIKIYGEWHSYGKTQLGHLASISIKAYKGGHPKRVENDEYLIETDYTDDYPITQYSYGNANMEIWSRSDSFDDGLSHDQNKAKYDKIYDYMGHVLYNHKLQAVQYVEPIIVGNRIGEYLPLSNSSSWAQYPLYADPDEYEISTEMKEGYIEAKRLDGELIYVKKK